MPRVFFLSVLIYLTTQLRSQNSFIKSCNFDTQFLLFSGQAILRKFLNLPILVIDLTVVRVTLVGTYFVWMLGNINQN